MPRSVILPNFIAPGKTRHEASDCLTGTETHLL